VLNEPCIDRAPNQHWNEVVLSPKFISSV
jgi:hypothetical protein